MTRAPRQLKSPEVLDLQSKSCGVKEKLECDSRSSSCEGKDVNWRGALLDCDLRSASTGGRHFLTVTCTSRHGKGGGALL